MLTLFKLCHAPVPTGMGVSWQRVGLPAAGGVGAQDAWTMQALDWLRAVSNNLIFERAKAGPSRSAKPAKGPARGDRPER